MASKYIRLTRRLILRDCTVLERGLYERASWPKDLPIPSSARDVDEVKVEKSALPDPVDETKLPTPVVEEEKTESDEEKTLFDLGKAAPKPAGKDDKK